jgi:peptide-methionine (R)-S-oxide reductase
MNTMITRRGLALGALGLLSGAAAAQLLRAQAAQSPKAAFEIEHTDTEWRTLLTPAQYRVLRKQGTEIPYTSPLNSEKRKGTYHCAGCDLPLFSSATKFNSRTGWPSFYAPLKSAVGTRPDYSHMMVRTEAHCRRCGGHLGHVFDDGPKPTGLRYCMNGVALTFKPATS